MSNDQTTCAFCFNQRPDEDLFEFMVDCRQRGTMERHQRWIVVCSVCSEPVTPELTGDHP